MKEIYKKLVRPCIGRDGSWVSRMLTFRRGGHVHSIPQDFFCLSALTHCLSLPPSLSPPPPPPPPQASPSLRSALQAFEWMLTDTSSSCRMAEVARLLGEKRVCKVDVDVCLSVVFYCLEREELQTALRELAKIVSLWKAFLFPCGSCGFFAHFTVSFFLFSPLSLPPSYLRPHQESLVCGLSNP